MKTKLYKRQPVVICGVHGTSHERKAQCVVCWCEAQVAKPASDNSVACPADATEVQKQFVIWLNAYRAERIPRRA